MSGGVDSSTVAALLCEQGYNVVGLTLQLWNQRRLAGHDGMPEAVQGRCCSIDDVYDARRVAETLGIPYYVVNQEQRFEDDVVRPFVAGVSFGTHADSVQPVQQPSEVRSVADHRAPDWRRPARHRTLRAQRIRRAQRPLAAEASGGSQQGPDLFPLRPDAGAVEPHAVSAGRDAQARCARRGEARRPAPVREARLAGDLLRSRRRLQAVSRRLSRGAGRGDSRHRRASWSRRLARSSARTAAFTTSPSDSARDSALPPDRRCTCWRSAATSGRWWSAAATSFILAHAARQARSTGLPSTICASPCACRPRFVIVMSLLRRHRREDRRRTTCWSPSTSRSAPSRPGRPSSSTTATSSSAAAGSPDPGNARCYKVTIAASYNGSLVASLSDASC